LSIGGGEGKGSEQWEAESGGAVEMEEPKLAVRINH
jgi:hypothetical protein